MDDGIRVGLLGPLEVWRRERPVRVASALQRMLVARLALDPGRTVAVEALVGSTATDRRDEPGGCAKPRRPTPRVER